MEKQSKRPGVAFIVLGAIFFIGGIISGLFSSYQIFWITFFILGSLLVVGGLALVAKQNKVFK